MTLKNFKPWWVLIGIGISAMIVLIDFTIVNTALSEIQLSLRASISELQWVMGAFGLTFATLLTLSGRVADQIGRRKVIYTAMLGFLLTSVGAGLAAHPWELILYRFLQGIFAAPFFPCGLAIVSDAFPAKTRGRAIAIYGSLLGIGLALGPVIGGFILEIASWRWIFFINVPIILLSFAICLPVVDESRKAGEEKIDWLGGLLLVLGLGTLIFAITEGPTYGWKTSLIILSFIAALLFLILFYFVERKASSPICPFDLFANRGFVIGTTTYVVSISCVWALMFLLSLYLQNVLDYSPGKTGVVLFVMTFMTIISPVAMGELYNRKGTKTAVLILFATIVIGYILQLFFTATGPLWLVVIAFVVFGWGWGTGNGIATSIAISHLKGTEDVGVVSGAALSVLNVVAIFWLALSVTLFRFGEKKALYHRLHESGITLTAEQEHQIKATLSDPTQATAIMKELGADVTTFFRESFVSGFHLAIWALLIWTLLLFFLVLPLLRKEQN